MVPCPLDTGSRVTMLAQSFFTLYFGDRGIHLRDASSFLTIHVANGLCIAYLGSARPKDGRADIIGVWGNY